MTEVREPGFCLDLPGEWEKAERIEPGGLAYKDTSGGGTVSVMLLAVRPVYAIADSRRLLEDYLKHRATFEKGQLPSLEQSEPVSQQHDDQVEGEWHAVDAATGNRLRHRVVLARNVLVDVCYQASGLDDAAFGELADVLLGSVRISTQ